ncbi:glycosyltransferase [Phenylobacterium sp. LjRoot219]|uniref:glycosyltransferase n=1 Tax=Phenylobacterium sp. LjRoot219 TaxID=3342283 RepID=UPI003ECFB3C3
MNQHIKAFPVRPEDRADRRPPMVIVHVLTRFLKTGGSEQNTIINCRAQAAEGHRVIIIHGSDFHEETRRAASEVAEVICVDALVHPVDAIRDARALVQMTTLFRRLRPDVVHTHQSKAGVLGRMAAKLADVPAIIHSVHILPFVNVGWKAEAAYKAVERFCALFTDAFISVSPSCRDAYLDLGIGRPDQHFVALSAMNVDRFKMAHPPEDWRELLRLEPGQAKPPTVVMVAAFEARKRQLELIRALPKTFAGLPAWRMLFVGDGELRAEAEALVAELGLGRSVCFSGYRTDPESLIALADVCMLTSVREGLPRVLIQYAAAGKPAVVSELPGLSDVVLPDVSAIITPPDNPVAAAQAAARLLSNPADCARLAKGARTVHVDAWSPESMMHQIRRAYESVMPRLRAPALLSSVNP